MEFGNNRKNSVDAGLMTTSNTINQFKITFFLVIKRSATTYLRLKQFRLN